MTPCTAAAAAKVAQLEDQLAAEGHRREALKLRLAVWFGVCLGWRLLLADPWPGGTDGNHGRSAQGCGRYCHAAAAQSRSQAASGASAVVCLVHPHLTLGLQRDQLQAAQDTRAALSRSRDCVEAMALSIRMTK